MMRLFILSLLFLGHGILRGATCTLVLHGQGLAAKPAVLYRYDDLLTRRLILLTRNDLNADGRATLMAEVEGRTRARLRVGEAVTDLYLMPGATYMLDLSVPSGKPRSIGATTALEVVFQDLDPLDINALTSDLNERIDLFVAEGLASDERAGMDAATTARQGGALRDTSHRPTTVYLNPAALLARVDSFAAKLRRFYAQVQDPFFQHELDYAIAGLYAGAQASPRHIWQQWIKGRAIAYGSPEQMRFLRGFFEKHLLMFPFRAQEQRLLASIRNAQRDSLDALVARHDFLRDDARLRELVWLDNLYTEYFGRTFDRKGMLDLMQQVERTSAFAEHRLLAANMRWDLTAMKPGATFPIMRLSDPTGELVEVNTLLEGPICFAVTASWCSWCAVEIEALKKLDAAYGKLVHFVVVSVDSSQADFRKLAGSYTSTSWHWLQAGADPLFMDALRLRSIPAFFLLNDRELSHAPAPLPSSGMVDVFHRLKVEAEQRNAIRFGSDAPAPTRPER
ncbi:MAG: hypothetical protein JNM31_15315 [Flavobacteriales bacterium]|nr:hypothetical protein [Flavobacteriales bacterium]